MFKRQPYSNTKPQGLWQQMLTTSLVAGVLAVVPFEFASAAIVNTVVATGKVLGVDIAKSATATVDVQDANPQFKVTKTGILQDGGDNSADPNDVITYTFTFTNTGNITLHNVSLNDTSAILTGSPIGTLLPGATDTLAYTAVHSLTAGDVALGVYTNIVLATADSAAGGQVTAGAVEKTPLNLVSSMLLTKTGALNMGANGRADAGDKITYTFTVTNTGPSVLKNVSVSDPLVNLASLPGQNRMIALLDAVQQGADPITTASVDSPLSVPPCEISAITYSGHLLQAPSVPPLATALNVQRQLLRMSGDTPELAAGDKIGFVFALYNSGEGPLTAISIDQPGATAFGDTLDYLAPNSADTASIIFTRSVTADEIASGEIIAPATITAHARGTSLTQEITSSVAISSLHDYDSFASATITPSNIATLNPGASTSFTALYTLTQSDVDLGKVNNTATATAKNLADQILTSTDSNTQTLVPVPGVAVIKTGNVNLGADNKASIGDIVTYHFAITNTGNVTLSDVGVLDLVANMAGTNIPSLAPGITNITAFTATHTLDQTDLDAGEVQNQASVFGTPPVGPQIDRLSDDDKLTETDPTIVKLAPAPKIALIKTVTSVNDDNNNGRTDNGDSITYGFKVKNVGNQTLTAVKVTDPKFTVLGAPITLDPDQEDATHFTGKYVITLADMDVGHVDNTATAEGLAPDNTKVTDDSDPGVYTQNAPTITPLQQLPKLTLIKTVTTIDDKNSNGMNDKDDVIHYQFTVNNAGNVTLDQVNVVEGLAGAAVQGAQFNNFAPGATSSVFNATYTITAADVQAGRVSNTATATAKSKTGTAVSDVSDNTKPDENDPTITPITAQPAVAVVKKIKNILDSNNNGVTDAGDTIVYNFSIKNVGNVTLTNVAVTDTNATVLPAAPFSIASLLAGDTDSTSFTATHEITPDDMADGQVENQATAVGHGPNGLPVTDKSDNASFTSDKPTIAYLANAPAIALVLVVDHIIDTNNNGINDEGDVIVYKMIVTNTGNIALNTITVVNPDGSINPGGPINLGVGGVNTNTFTYSHAVTNADMLLGYVNSQAHVQGYSVTSAGTVSDDSDNQNNLDNNPTITPLAQLPGIALIKKMKSYDDKDGSGTVTVGDVLHYSFDITNIGNVALTNVKLSDDLVDANSSITPASIANLPAKTTLNNAFTATHTVTPAEAAAGQVSNSATINADGPGNTNVTDKSDPTTLTGNAPTITPVIASAPVLTKTAAKSEVKRGETVQYTIIASNLQGGPFQLTDIMPPGFGYVTGSATVNGVAKTPIIDVRNLNFINLTPSAGKLTLKLKLLASTTLGGGKFVNNAHLVDPTTGNVIATAQATVSIVTEPVFDCSDIIGRVFDDKNANGYMDDGEPGLPGVRVVTLNGVLITTDSEGRYHVACADVPDASIGSNYLLKLDVRTLPTGYKLTTENPRDVRITRGKVVKLNFGASILREVRVDLNGKAFDKGTADLTSKWASSIDKLLVVLSKNRSTLKLVYHQGGESSELAQARVDAVAETIAFAWKAGHGAYDLETTTSVEEGK